MTCVKYGAENIHVSQEPLHSFITFLESLSLLRFRIHFYSSLFENDIFAQCKICQVFVAFEKFEILQNLRNLIFRLFEV